MYAFTLEKYRGTKTRHTCPACGVKGVFVRYVDAQGRSLANDVGRCNRESKCAYHRKPREYFADNPDQRAKPASPPRRIAQALRVTAPTVNHLAPRHFDDSLQRYEQNAFVKFLQTLFDSATLQGLLDRFGIGTFTDGRTIFWQIDRQGQLRTGLIIRYGTDGKRDKTVNPFWMHKALERRGLLPSNFALRQCFFGEHQLDYEPEKLCAVVEAPKTAVIASGLMPEFVWLATGGKSNLNAEKFAVLQDRQVILFPDADGFHFWTEKARTLRGVCPYLQVADLLEIRLTDDQKAAGYDIADFLIMELQSEAQEHLADAATEPAHVYLSPCDWEGIGEEEAESADSYYYEDSDARRIEAEAAAIEAQMN